MKKIYDENYNYKGHIDEDGRFYDENYNYKGHVDEDGRYYDENYNYKGHTDEDGRHYDENYNYKGHTDEDGRCYDENYKYKGHSEKDSSNGCYLTTACVEYKGLSDNCKELTLLRNFRDTYMKNNSSSDIDKYYEVAPRIVDKINKLDENLKNKYYDYIYSIVNKCCTLIENQQFDDTHNEYKLMVEKLSNI